MCQVVIPVAGLIAQAATTFRQDENNALRAIAVIDRDDATELLLSAQRFVALDAPTEVDAPRSACACSSASACSASVSPSS